MGYCGITTMYKDYKTSERQVYKLLNSFSFEETAFFQKSQCETKLILMLTCHVQNM